MRKHHLYDIALSLDAKGMVEADKFPPSELDWAQHTLLSRWLDLDDAAAFDWSRKLPNEEHQHTMLREFFHSLGLKDASAAVSFLGALGKTNHSDEFRSELFDGWAETDPAGAAHYAMQLPRKADRDAALGTAIHGWGEKDPQAALASVNQIADPRMRASEMSNVMRGWASNDPKAAAASALGLAPGKVRDAAVLQVLESCVAEDHDLSIRLLAELPRASDRANAISNIAFRLGNSDPKAAADFVLQLPLSSQQNVAMSIARNYARQDVAGALQWAAALTSPDTRNQATTSILQSWAEDDPRAAANYCVKNVPDDTQAISSVVSDWMQTDPQAALSWASALPEGKQRDQALFRGLRQLADTDPTRAIDYARNSMQGAGQQSALSEIATAWAANEPQAAGNWVLQSGIDVNGSIASSIASTWGQQDPQAAASWLIQNAKEPAGSIGNVLRNWARQSPADVAAWMNQIAAGPIRDNAIVAFTGAVEQSDPETAGAWSVSIGDDAQRRNAIRNVVSNWMNQDKNAAKSGSEMRPAFRKISARVS